MTEMEGKDLERVCGRVEGFNPKTKKIGILLIPEGLKLPETYWAWRDDATQDVVCKDGGVLEIGNVVVFDFSRNPDGKGGSFKNVEGSIERVVVKPQPAASPLQPAVSSTENRWTGPANPNEDDEAVFTPASDLNEDDLILDEAAKIQSRCYDRVKAWKSDHREGEDLSRYTGQLFMYWKTERAKRGPYIRKPAGACGEVE